MLWRYWRGVIPPQPSRISTTPLYTLISLPHPPSPYITAHPLPSPTHPYPHITSPSHISSPFHSFLLPPVFRMRLYTEVELIFHPNLEYLRKAAETPVLDDLRMVDTFVVLKTIQTAGVSAHIRRNSKTLQCAYMRKTVLVTRNFSAYIRRNSKISKLSQNENNSAYLG